MKSAWKDWTVVRSFAHNLGFISTAWKRPPVNHLPTDEFSVPSDFFGICVASSPEKECDDYVLSRLNELGLSRVRVDMARGRRNERFLERLLENGYRVCLHLVQAKEEAADMANKASAARWREFANDMLNRFGRRVDSVEIGSVCNRRKWSGYTLSSFFQSWRIAFEVAAERNVKVAGPNVTDFEPVYNAAILGELKRKKLLPSIHTDNLFVERAIEPEAFDHKILGRRLAGLPRYNLIKKAQLLRNISIWAGVPSTICSHVSWSRRRIARQHGDVEQKQADYLSRYCCLAAASGSLDAVYWGPLIGQREGLIDDGTSFFPEIPHVAFYGTVNGQMQDFRIRPAFAAFQTTIRFIAGSRFKRKHQTGAGLEILEFEKDDSLFHVVWTRDGLQAAAEACYEPKTLRTASAYSRDGVQLATVPQLFSESPTYLKWPREALASPLSSAAPVIGLRFAGAGQNSFSLIDAPPWSGAMTVLHDGISVDAADLIHLAAGATTGEAPGGSSVLRDDRNLVWKASAPWNTGRSLIIKRFKPRNALRKILDAHKPDKAQRSWNSSQELIRRGLSTPMPIAFFHKARSGSGSECYFICEEFDNAKSARDFFNEYQREPTSKSEARQEADSTAEAPPFFDALAKFIVDMHERGVFFRDLSAGNILFRMAGQEGIEFSLIDTARARFYPDKIGSQMRLHDLKRICHPLNWKNRELFIGKYMSASGLRFSWWMKAPFVLYDLKHAIKNFIKPLRGKRR